MEISERPQGRLTSALLRAAGTDGKGDLSLPTLNGAVKYDGERFVAYTTDNGFLVNDVRDVLEDSRENLWFATYGGGAVRYDGETFQPITTKEGLIQSGMYDLRQMGLLPQDHISVVVLRHLNACILES